MEQQPILNPPNPYVGTLRLFPGTLVKVYCRPRPNASRFAINLQTGPSLNPRDDLALHLSPCFNPPRLIRNSLQHGQWGLEESWGNGSVMTPHQSFEFIILVEPDRFKIALNGAHYCEFNHRIPFEHVSHLTIDGDVDIERIHITSQSSGYQPSAPQPSSTANAPYPPYPVAGGAMPMPSMYPTLDQTSRPSSGPYPTIPSAAPYPPAAPMPAGASYTNAPGYGGAGHPPAAYPQAGGSYPGQPAGPMPAAGSYQGGYPNLPQQHHPQGPYPSASSSSGPFGMGGKALGTLAGVLKEGVYRKFPLARQFL